MSSRAPLPNVPRSDPPREVPACLGAVLLGLVALGSGCTIQTVGSQPPPRTANAEHAATPTPATAAGGSQPSTGTEELTALHASVAANVGTVRRLLDAVGEALRDPGLGAESRRAHERGFAKGHSARQALNSGKHRLAQDEAGEAKRFLAPAVRELSAKSRLPAALLTLLTAHADESATSVARAMEALRATGNTAGIESYEQASAAFADAAAGARAGDGARALRSLLAGSGHLERGTLARWPRLSTR